MAENLETATLAGGCFWCTEAIFKRLKGVLSVMPGYAGGHVENPTYEQVSTGTTGHAESTQIEFDPSQISYEKLVDVFFRTHDPTTLNRQGPDVGPQYRSAIFYHDEKQRKTAEKVKERIEKEGVYESPIVTEVVPFKNFYPAEAYHRDFYARNPDYPYSQSVIEPKIEKLEKEFKEELS